MNHEIEGLSCDDCGGPIDDTDNQWCAICRIRKLQESRFQYLVDQILQSCNEEHLPAAISVLENTFRIRD